MGRGELCVCVGVGGDEALELIRKECDDVVRKMKRWCDGDGNRHLCWLKNGQFLDLPVISPNAASSAVL